MRLIFWLQIIVYIVAYLLTIIALNLTSAIYYLIQIVLIIFFCLIKLTNLSCINSSAQTDSFLLLLLQVQFLVLVLLMAFFFLLHLKLLGGFNFLFCSKIVCLISQRGFKLCFLALFSSRFFCWPSLYQLVVSMVFLVKVIAGKGLYFSLDLNLGYFFD